MTNVQRADAIRGKTIRLSWTEGPTKGSTHEHVFHDDGTVQWRNAGQQPSTEGKQKSRPAAEKADYAAIKVSEGIYAVSYLAASGYTLTVVLNFRDNKVVGFASSSKDWHPVQGTFQVVT